jgi:hypothetical protein
MAQGRMRGGGLIPVLRTSPRGRTASLLKANAIALPLSSVLAGRPGPTSRHQPPSEDASAVPAVAGATSATSRRGSTSGGWCSSHAPDRFSSTYQSSSRP